MKPSTLIPAIYAALLLISPGTANAATTYTIVRASISLPGYVKGKDAAFNDILIRRTLSTNAIINLALGLPTKTRVPRTTVLVAAGEDFNLRNGLPTAFRLLVVDLTNPAVPVKLAEVLKPDATSTFLWAENHISARFLRVGVGQGEVITVGNITGGNKVQTSGTLRRTPSLAGPLPIVSSSISGQFTFKDDDGVTKTALVLAGRYTASGKRLGTLTF